MSLEEYTDILQRNLEATPVDSHRISLALTNIQWLKAENNSISKELVDKCGVRALVTQVAENPDLGNVAKLKANLILKRWSEGKYDAPFTDTDKWKKQHARGGGSIGLLVGQCWPSRKLMDAEKVHAGLQAGISGGTTYGAYSIVANGVYSDIDKGEHLWYCGTFAKEGKQKTPGTRYLERSQKTGNPVRVFRGEKSGEFAPTRGFRYDGLYKVTDQMSVAGKPRFKLERIAGQDPIQREMPDPLTREEWQRRELAINRSAI